MHETPAPRVGGTLVTIEGQLVCRTDDGRESADFQAEHGAAEGDSCTIVDEKKQDGSATASSASTSSLLTGYLVAVGHGALACDVGGTQYANYSAESGAGEGDACTVDPDAQT